MTDLVTIGFKADTSGLTSAQTQLDKTAAAGKRVDSASKKIEGSMGKIGRSAGQAGIQVQQFVGQIQGGQSAMLALSQQGADLGFVLGQPLLGAVVGISASLAGFLIPNLINSSTEIEELVKRINELDEAANKTAAQNRVLALSNEEEIASISKRNDAIAEQIELLERQLRAQTQAGTGLDEGQFAVPRTAAANQERYAESIKETNRELKLLRGELDTNNQDIIRLSKATADLGKEGETAAEKTKSITQALQTQIIALEGGAQAAEVYALTQQAIANGTESELPRLIELINRRYEIKRATDEANEAEKRSLITKREKAKLDAKAAAAEKQRANTLQALQDRLNPLAAAQRKFNEELKLLESIGDSDSIENLKSEFEGIQEALNGTEIDNGLSKLIDDVDNLSYGFSNLGNVIADSFGDAVAQLNNFAGKMEEIQKLREKAIIEQGKYTKGTIEHQQATEQLARINQEMYSAQLGAIGGVLGAAKGMFKEQSKEREALHRLEMGFMVAEMALAAEKAVINATNAITSAAAAPFPVGFAAAASMTALMAGVLGAVGIAFSGSSGGYDVGAAQEAQGTGTEFGDSSAKADSLVRLQERFEDIQIDQLSELRGIRDAMDGLSNGIAQLALDIVGAGRIGNYTGDLSGSQKVSLDDIPLLGGAFSGLLDGLTGGFVGDILDSVLGGLFGSTKKKLIDEGLLFEAQEIGELISGGIIDATYFATIETTKKKLFGLSKKTSTKDETSALDDAFSEQIGLIFNYLADSVSESIGLLGIETERSIEDFVINIGKISFKDMTGEEIQAELEAVFSQQGDLIAKYMWPNVTEYQKLGEGALETLLRVTQEQVAFNNAIENLGLTLDDLEPNQLIDVSQALIELFGGLEGFSESVSEYYDAFFSDAEKLEMLTSDVGEAFASLGIIAPQTKEGFRELVESIDLTTESGRALFAALMEIAPAFAEVIEGWEESALEEAARLEEERNNAINEAMQNLREAVAVERERADEALAASREAYNAEKERIELLIDGLNEELELREQALSDSESMLKASFNAEAEKIQAASNARIDALNSEILAINELKSVATAEYEARVQAAVDAEQKLTESFNAEMVRLQTLSDERIALINEEIAAVDELKSIAADEYKARVDAAKNAESALKSSLDAEIDRISAASDKRIENLNAEIAAIEEMAELSEQAYNERLANLERADGLLGRAFDAEISSIQDASAARVSALQDEISDINSASKARQSALSNERSKFSEIASTMGALADRLRAAVGISANTDVLAALMAARQGDFSLAESLEVPTIGAGGFSSASEMQFAQMVQRAQVGEIADLASGRASIAERQLSAIEQQTLAVESSAQMQIDAINEQIEAEQNSAQTQIDALNEQLNALRGIDNSIVSIQEAIEIFTTAQRAASEKYYEDEQARFAEQIDALNAQIAEQEANTQSFIDALTNSISELLGIDTSVLSLSDAIDAYMEAQAAIDEDGYNALLASYDEQITLLNQQIADDELATQEQIAELEAQLNALLGIDTSIMSVEDAIKFLQDAQAAIDEAGYNEIIASYDEQIALINEQIANEQAATEAQLSALNDQLNALLGIDTTILGLSDAIQRYQDAKLHLDELNYDEQLAHLESLLTLNDEMLAEAIAQHAIEMARLDSALEAAQKQIDALNGIDDSVKTVAEALADIKELIFGFTGGDKKKDDIIIVTPLPIDTWAEMGQQPTQAISDDVIQVLESIARNTATSANNSTRQRIEGVFTRQV